MQSHVLLNKPQGLTPLQAITAFKKQHPLYQKEKLSFAGRLDPMAEGLLIILVGDENKKRHIYEELPKTYQFELLLGINTDTYDCLGRIKTLKIPPLPEITTVKRILKTYIGTHKQPYPPFSSKTVEGKPLYYWARADKIGQITIPMKEITITSLNLNSISLIKQKKLVQGVINRIKKVQGDFRQERIIKDWTELQTPPQSLFPLLMCTATVSSGTYIRSLCQGIGEKMGYPALAFSIKRTVIGDYTLTHAITLHDHTTI